jgi:pimeloyl-ACP methyl ester carboxylesterase
MRKLMKATVSAASALVLLGGWTASADAHFGARCRDARWGVTVDGERYVLRGTVCRPPSGKTAKAAVVLVHGATYDETYWLPPKGEGFSTAETLARQGYVVAVPNRLGSGRSDRPAADKTGGVAQTEALAQAFGQVQKAEKTKTGKVVVVGHSAGSAASLLTAARKDGGNVDLLVLTGFIHSSGPGVMLFPALTYSANQDPKWAGKVPEGYITTQPGTRALVFANPWNMDEKIARADERRKDASPPSGDWFNDERATAAGAARVRVPVLSLIGRYDTAFCNPETRCAEAKTERAKFSASEDVTVTVLDRSGHAIALEHGGDDALRLIQRWVERRL